MSIKFKQPLINLRKLFNDFYCHTHPEYINEVFSNKNIIINPIFLINQRGFDGNWSGLTDTAFGYDRWRKLGTDIVQPIEADNYQPDTIYTLSGINIKETQLLSPASGTWEITVLNTANEIKLEKGNVKTSFEYPDISTELLKCQRYYIDSDRFEPVLVAYNSTTNLVRGGNHTFKTTMRDIPDVVIKSNSGIADIAPYSITVDGFRSLGTADNAIAQALITGYTADAEL